jgi:hypothetical protein
MSIWTTRKELFSRGGGWASSRTGRAEAGEVVDAPPQARSERRSARLRPLTELSTVRVHRPIGQEVWSIERSAPRDAIALEWEGRERARA